MKSKLCQKYLLTALIAAVVFVSIPQQASARNLFRQFFHDIKRATNFIVKLPDKATRWMGPVLGPIASGILTQNLAGHHKFGQLFTKIKRANNVINDIDEQRRLTGEIKEMYHDQAGELRNYVKKLEEARETLRSQLTSRDVNVKDYIQTAIELDKMIATVNQTADRFDNSADRLSTADVIKMAGSSLLNEVAGEVKNIALSELNDEILSAINPNIIRLLTEQNSVGLDTLLDMLINQETEGYDGEFNLDELRDRIKDRIKDALQENKDNWQGNIKDHIQAILQEMADKMGEETGNLTDQGDEMVDNLNEMESNEPVNPYSDDELAATLSEIPKDEFGCGPGYIWKRMSGVGCVQEDCAAVGGHYSYTQACICGLVDPPPGAKTKACMRPSNYLPCPSCLFACIGSDEDCPER